MNQGAGMDDYFISIGEREEVCELTDLSSNQLVCRPPPEEPTFSPDNFLSYKGRRIPHVKVSATLSLIQIWSPTSLGFMNFYESVTSDK